MFVSKKRYNKLWDLLIETTERKNNLAKEHRIVIDDNLRLRRELSELKEKKESAYFG